MFGSPFRHSLLQKYVVAFGSLFSNLSIVRPTTANTTFQQVKVPVIYAQKDKMFVRLNAAPNANTMGGQVGLTLPLMAFERTTLQYDSSRKLQTTLQQRFPTTNMYVPVPYNIGFALRAVARNYSDADQLIEQIVPFFTPQYTLVIKTLEELGLEADTPISLNSVRLEDTVEGNFDDRRFIIWTLDFTVKGWMYGPTQKSALIKEVIVNLHLMNDTTDVPSYILLDDSDLLEDDDGTGFIVYDDGPDDSTTNMPMVTQIDITPNPATAQPGDNYTYNTVITDVEGLGLVFNPLTGENEFSS